MMPNSLQRIHQKRGLGEMLLFYKTNITLIPKSDKDIKKTTKQFLRSIDIENIYKILANLILLYIKSSYVMKLTQKFKVVSTFKTSSI